MAILYGYIIKSIIRANCSDIVLQFTGLIARFLILADKQVASKRSTYGQILLIWTFFSNCLLYLYIFIYCIYIHHFKLLTHVTYFISNHRTLQTDGDSKIRAVNTNVFMFCTNTKLEVLYTTLTSKYNRNCIVTHVFVTSRTTKYSTLLQIVTSR